MHCAQHFVNFFSRSCGALSWAFRVRNSCFSRVLGVRGLLYLGWDALLRYWGAVSRHGECGPVSSLHPWVPPDLHGFYKWVFDSREVLNGFLGQVVVSRWDVGVGGLDVSVDKMAQGGLEFWAVCLASA